MRKEAKWEELGGKATAWKRRTELRFSGNLALVGTNSCQVDATLSHESIKPWCRGGPMTQSPPTMPHLLQVPATQHLHYGTRFPVHEPLGSKVQPNHSRALRYISKSQCTEIDVEKKQEASQKCLSTEGQRVLFLVFCFLTESLHFPLLNLCFISSNAHSTELI